MVLPRVKDVPSKQSMASSRQKESYARSAARDSYQPTRQRSTPKYSHKSSSLVNVSKTREEFEKKYNTGESDLEETHLQTLKKSMKSRKKSKEQGDKLTMSSDPLDSGFASSRRESFSSHISSHSSFSEESVSTDFSKEKGKQSKVKGSMNEIGFGQLPNQVYKKAVRKGFEFSLMVVGESGLGKSTLVNSMFLEDIYEREEQISDSEEQTLQVETHHAVLEENGVRLDLTVVDTPGFGDAVDNSDCWQPIIDYVDKQFEDFLEKETKVDRVEVPDTRVHACLYFIAPTGHGLKPLDIQCLRKIHQKVNIIPVIGKADSCTKNELEKFKSKVISLIYF